MTVEEFIKKLAGVSTSAEVAVLEHGGFLADVDDVFYDDESGEVVIAVK